MKIIKEGTVPNIFGGTCNWCGCEVEVERNEATYVYREGKFAIFCLFVKCPTENCREDINVVPTVSKRFSKNKLSPLFIRG